MKNARWARAKVIFLFCLVFLATSGGVQGLWLCTQEILWQDSNPVGGSQANGYVPAPLGLFFPSEVHHEDLCQELGNWGGSGGRADTPKSIASSWTLPALPLWPFPGRVYKSSRLQVPRPQALITALMCLRVRVAGGKGLGARGTSIPPSPHKCSRVRWGRAEPPGWSPEPKAHHLGWRGQVGAPQNSKCQAPTRSEQAFGHGCLYPPPK